MPQKFGAILRSIVLIMHDFLKFIC